MTLHLQSWENRLVAWAKLALDGQSAVTPLSTDQQMLDAAYAYCEQFTRTYSRTFHLASSLLPWEKRRAVRALYAFCRVTDNIVDDSGPQEDPKAKLENWHEHVLNPRIPVDNPVATAWADTRARFGVPWRYAEQLISGVAADMQPVRYSSFEQLAEYCYLVASTVGLMAMHVIGFEDETAVPYAVKLGVALQLTNILRDVGEDWRKGRLYLPLDELALFDLDERAVAAGVVDERWRHFMAFQIDRNRRLYAEALPGIAKLNPDGRFAIAAAAELYAGILDDIEAHDYDVFSRRAHVSTWGKLRRLPAIWWRSRTVSAPAQAYEIVHLNE